MPRRFPPAARGLRRPLRVSAAVVANEGTALDVVREIYEDLKAAGRQYDEGNFLEDAYNEEGNNACRVAVYS